MSEEISEKQQKEDFRKMLVETKKMAESYVVLSIYKQSELFHDANLTVDDITNLEWKFFFSIAKKLIEDKKFVLDDITVGLRVSENESLQKMYDEFGGWNTIQQGMSFVQESNFDGYVRDVKKTNALIKLHDLGFPIMEKFDAYKVASLESIQQKLEEVLATVFANVDISEKVEDMSKGLWQTVLDAHAGKMRGFPYYSAMLNEHVNGQALGNITMVSANSGVGKTAFTLMQVLPNMIEYNESLLILANEEDISKWKREIITWAVNNMTGGDFQKNRFNYGEFTQEELTMLKKGVDWLEEKMKEGTIRFINFNSFSMQKAIKMIKKEATMNGVKYFILDTLKLDSDAVNENAQAWLSLQTNMVKLYDLVKPSNKNVHVYVTYQLGKSAMLTRYLSQNSLGVSKNVVDVVSTLMLNRKALESEKEGGKNEVEIKEHGTGKTVKMSKDKEYFIVFLGKNRMGGTHRQLVFEADLGKNQMTDIGTCLIEQDI